MLLALAIGFFVFCIVVCVFGSIRSFIGSNGGIMLLYIATAICLAGQLADWWTTKWGLSKGGKELSKFPAWLLKQHFGIWRLFAAKVLLGLAPLLLNLAFHFPISNSLLGFSGAGLGFWDAYHNYVNQTKFLANRPNEVG